MFTSTDQHVHTFENRQCINLAYMLIDLLPQYSKNNTNCVCQGLDLCVVGENQIYVAHATLVSFVVLNLSPECVTVYSSDSHIAHTCALLCHLFDYLRTLIMHKV